jgi:nitrite reductase/ring-hydroxylating ferredoxin subunit
MKWSRPSATCAPQQIRSIQSKERLMNPSNLVKVLSRWFNREDWLDRYAKPVQNFIPRLLNGAGKPGQAAANLLNGTWFGHPVHAVLTDVAIGALTTAVTLDAIEASTGRRGIGRAADQAVALGVAGAVGSALTGAADWQHTTGESRRVGFVHALINTSALGLFVFSLVSRGNRQRGTGRALAMAGFGALLAGSYLGGDLVYRLRIGIDHAPEDADLETKDFVAVMSAAQLPENQLTQAALKNIPLVLLRRGERVYALAATCAHLGGPLPEGRLEQSPEGHPVVVCPWHSSRFDMEDGAALDGPTAYPQPCLDARIRDGQVEVRYLVK